MYEYAQEKAQRAAPSGFIEDGNRQGIRAVGKNPGLRLGRVNGRRIWAHWWSHDRTDEEKVILATPSVTRRRNN